MFWFFGHETRGIWAPQPGTEPASKGSPFVYKYNFQNDKEAANSGSLWEWNQTESERCLFFSSHLSFLGELIFSFSLLNLISIGL